MNRLRQVATVAELRALLDGVRRQGSRIGLVPTMGALHEGHLSLVRACRQECEFTVASIYVNPSQFGPREDFDKYPRPLEDDLARLVSAGTDVAFLPATDEMYRPGFATWVEPGAVAEPLEGQCRPGHFRGVATIVLKLFLQAAPHAAYFGSKDYQQVLVIRQMVRDLDLPVTIRVCPTVREPDGLAMSSRNRYLGREGRQRALLLWKSLCAARELVAGGQRSAAAVEARMREVLRSAGEVRIDYVALADPETLEPVRQINRPVLAALAVWVDGTRLIDNDRLEPPGAPAREPQREETS
jgi:pantoate--beta-alanine ligase